MGQAVRELLPSILVNDGWRTGHAPDVVDRAHGTWQCDYPRTSTTFWCRRAVRPSGELHNRGTANHAAPFANHHGAEQSPPRRAEQPSKNNVPPRHPWTTNSQPGLSRL